MAGVDIFISHHAILWILQNINLSNIFLLMPHLNATATLRNDFDAGSFDRLLVARLSVGQIVSTTLHLLIISVATPALSARLRPRVRTHEPLHGSGRCVSPVDAHELALKAAETDAMKRALSTFGNPFGLALYDKEQAGVRRTKAKKAQEWIVFNETGKTLSTKNTPAQFCSEIRRTLENINEYPALMAFWNQNQNSVAELRRLHPRLKTEKGLHYGEVLSDLYTRRLSAFAADKNITSAAQPIISAGNNPEIGENIADSNNGTEYTSPDAPPSGLCKGPLRARDPSHLKFIASQACLICGRTPSQAHHLKHAQLRALGRKSGDQWAVPLCAIHHRELHDHGNEAVWWPSNNIDPLKVAEKLWHQKR